MLRRLNQQESKNTTAEPRFQYDKTCECNRCILDALCWGRPPSFGLHATAGGKSLRLAIAIQPSTEKIKPALDDTGGIISSRLVATSYLPSPSRGFSSSSAPSASPAERYDRWYPSCGIWYRQLPCIFS